MTIRGTMSAGGVEIPRLGLGVYRSGQGIETRAAVRWALEAGYRHIDTAAAYGNEEDVGEAIRTSGIARGEVFVTTKLWNQDHGYDAALRAFDRSLESLGIDFVDLYLIHWPVADLRRESWRALEQIHADGRARAIGVSNYMVRHLDELLAHAHSPPAVNQIELHPFIFRTREEVVALCRRHGIAIEAYSPLTKGRRMGDPVLRRVADAHGRSVAQVLIRYDLQKDTIVLPKSAHRDRIRENAQVFDFTLTAEEMALLDGLDEGLATGWDPTNAP